MTTATLARSAAVAAPARTGPRLLLPPRATPSTPVPPQPAVWRGPAEHSVLASVTERLWPVVVPPAPVAPAEEELPDPTQLCGALVLATVEVLSGVRPLAQLTRWVAPEVVEQLEGAAITRPAPADGRPGTAATGAPPAPRRLVAVRRATVRRVLLTRLSPTAAEAAVVVHDGSRVRAAAVRLEVHRGHWRATVIQIG